MISLRAMSLSLAMAVVGGPALAQQQTQTQPRPKAQQQPESKRAEPPQTERAQEPAGEPGPQALMAAQERVLKAQEQALKDPELKKDLDELQAFVEAQMQKEDPKAKQKMDRLETIQAQLEKLQAAENPDPEKAAPLIGEAQQLATELSQVQLKVLEKEEVKRRMDIFDKKLRAEMRQIDPEVPQALARLEKAAEAQGQTATP